MTTRRVSSGLRVSRSRVRARPFTRRRTTPTPGPDPAPPTAPAFAATFGTDTAALYLGGITPGTVIDWGDGATDEFPDGTASTPVWVRHTYPSDGPYQMTLTGGFAQIGDGASSIGASLESIDLWEPSTGTVSAFGAFALASHLVAVVEPPPTVVDMSYMFYYATAFNQDISGWNTSGVTDMNHMFNGAAAFDQDLSGWDVANVTSHGGFETGSALSPEHLPQWVS